MKKCLICGETRYINNCHIFPKCFFSGVKGSEDLYEKGGKNNVLLCPNHHYFYDNFLLTKDEAKILEEKCKEVFSECVRRVRNIDLDKEENRESWVMNCHLFRRKEKIEKFIDKHKKQYGDWKTNSI